MKFLRNLLAAILGTFIALGIIFMLTVITVSVASKSEKIAVQTNSVLEINLESRVKDYAPKSGDPLDEIFGYNDDKIGLNEIINAIENAKTDSNIQGISISTMWVNAGIAQTQAIRKKLEEFKESGKFITAYADFYNQKSYYLSSVADSVFLNPVGAIDFKGLSTEILFYKDFEDKTGVKMEVVRHGKYKSAVEPFLFNEMSDDNRGQLTSFIKSIWGEMITEISKSRNISLNELNEIADGLLARNVTLALENKIIDEAIYYDEYKDKLKLACDISAGRNLRMVSLEDYIASGKGRIRSTASNRIAVIYAQGDIIYGRGNENFIGQDLIINALRKARKSNSVKAIVLRVNSPGGSALASELIWRELELTKEEVPLVVSMGNLATSGGYYLSCNADRIFAEPTTITGSIGVFGIIPNISKLADNIGINAEQVHTNKGPSYSVFEPMSADFRTVTVESIEAIYTTFLDRVSAGRNMTIQAVDSVAQGRVWTGVEALNNGLVDELGTLKDAISYAAELADITDYRVYNYPNYKMDFEDRFKGFPFIKSKEKILIEELGEVNYKMYQTIKKFTNLNGIQARIPFIMEIE